MIYDIHFYNKFKENKFIILYTCINYLCLKKQKQKQKNAARSWT